MFGKYVTFDIDRSITVNKASAVMIARTPSATDSFLCEIDDKPDGGKIVFMVSDIGVLFNQQRIMSLNPQYLHDLVARMKQSSPSLNVPDDVLMSSLKSRYIQSNADVYTWYRQVNEDLETTVSDIKAEQERLNAAAAAQQADAGVPASADE